ncbi:hypothetical protein N5079_00595 [Planotetraspora sp. A-T 1434]|uniref:hypothetical protein n=1 Tax=Planotetraspora sp. A-T 1434 TaxID=2979219 RepID=UPI0021C09AC5|nr:hypothetical protein [Planotetraspora sp. A-T 1434]MCT9928708.1 hypothetical protein [Planotetraspora sp. A-T 1434]
MTTPLQMSAPETGGRRALTLAIMALVFTLMLPAAGLALSVFGIIIAIRDLRSLQRGRQRVGMATSALVISSIAFLLGAGTTAVQLYFSAEISAYTECRKGAGTVEAQQECSDQFKHAFEQKLGVPWPAGIPAPA